MKLKNLVREKASAKHRQQNKKKGRQIKIEGTNFFIALKAVKNKIIKGNNSYTSLAQLR